MTSTHTRSRTPLRVSRSAPAPAGLPAPRTGDAPAGPGPLTGRFRYDLRSAQWWWSPQLFQLHGLRPGERRPGVSLLLAGVHPEDRARVHQAFADACTGGVPFAVEHRLVRSDGGARTAVLVGELETGPDGAPTALSGLVVDVTRGRLPDPGSDRVRCLETEVEQLRTAMASRAAIEQAKGVLMLLTGCGDQVAFELLAHISSHTHRKARDVATAIVDSAGGGDPLPADVRAILHDACPPGGPPR